MKRLVYLLLVLGMALPVCAHAQSELICKDSSGYKDAPSCDSSGNLNVTLGGAATAATFAAADATTSITGSFVEALDPVDNTKIVVLDNQTNGDVWVSMDGGTTSHFHLSAGDVLTLNLAGSGLIQSAAIDLKDGTTASTSGTFYIYTYK